jgi:cohesin complex subunit SCC1
MLAAGWQMFGAYTVGTREARASHLLDAKCGFTPLTPKKKKSVGNNNNSAIQKMQPHQAKGASSSNTTHKPASVYVPFPWHTSPLTIRPPNHILSLSSPTNHISHFIFWQKKTFFLPAPTPTESIINPEAPLALRLSGQLMLGVVRIYGRKVNYLFQDCSEALVKVKQAFRADTVDLPADGDTAPLGVITLPDNYDDLELFFEPHAAAGFGHMGGDATTARGTAEKANITLDDPDIFDEFEEQYAYDDRIHMDMDDDEYMEDELDPHFHPTPGRSSGGAGTNSDYRTPMAGDAGGAGSGPHRSGVSNPADRRDIMLEDYDEAGGGDEGQLNGGGGGDDEQVMHYPDDDVEPLPLDDDLEDEDGVRGTAVPPGSTVGGASTGSGEGGGGVQFKTPSVGFAPAPVTPGTGSTGVVLDFGRTAQRGRRADGPKLKRAPRNRKATARVAEFDEMTMLSNEHIRLQLKDTSDIVKKRTAGVVNRMTSLADDDMPYGADENVDEGARGGRGGFNIGYYRDGYKFAPPPESNAEAFGVLRGTLGGRDPLMGHQMSKRMAETRAKCLEALWRRAGEHWGAGYTGGATGDGNARSRGAKRGAAAAAGGGGGASVAGTAAGGAASAYGGSGSGGDGTGAPGSSRGGRSVYDAYDEDDDGGMPMPDHDDHDDFAMPSGGGGGGGGSEGRTSPGGTVVDEEFGTSRQQAARGGHDDDDAQMGGTGMGMMGMDLDDRPVPPTPANAPKVGGCTSACTS